MDEVSLLIDGQTFKAQKSVLSQYSDYFKAMFSGNYVENNKKEISIDVVDAESMRIILQYMKIGLIDLYEYPLATIGELVVAANFLQITELTKQIEYTLESQIVTSNCIDIMTMAQNSAFTKLEQLSAAYGLLAFKDMKPQYIPNINKLCWYLSHPYIDAPRELDVFNFGHNWILRNETGCDALLIVLGCLDVSRLTVNNLAEIKASMKDYENSLAEKVVECLCKLAESNEELSLSAVELQKMELLQTFSERVYNEVTQLIKESKKRVLEYTPAVPVWTVNNTKLELVPHNMYTFNKEKGFEKWLEVADKNLWGWSVIAWGTTRLVVVCGEHGRGGGVFMKDVKVYDTLRKEWIQHGVDLPSRRHGGVAVIEDSLFIVGGVGGFRVVLDTAIIYDLRHRTYRKIAKLPDAIQNPAVCSHKGAVYAAGHRNIYKYEDFGQTDRWTRVVSTEIRTNCMTSFDDYIYCTQNYFSHLYRFRPSTDHKFKLELISYFKNPPAAVCNLGDRLLFFTRSMCGLSNNLNVEEYTACTTDEPRVLWARSESSMKINDVAGSCALVMDIPPLYPESSGYTKKYLKGYISS